MSILNRLNRFIKRQKVKARKAYLRREGFLAQISMDSGVVLKKRVRRKYMALRETYSRRGMDGRMR